MQIAVLQQLLSELLGVEGVMLVMDTAGAVSEMHVRNPDAVRVDDGWATIETTDWHVHLNLVAVEGVQFVEADDRLHDGIARLYYARLSGASEDTLLRFYFPNPWLDDNERPTEFQPEKLTVFEEFRDRWVGRGGVEFVRRSA